MKKTYLLLVLFLGSIAFMSCMKQPVANFSPDKMIYESGETVYLTNRSTDAASYMWILPNTSPSFSQDVQYRIADNFHGNLEFTLFAYSKNKRKEATYSQTVQVNQPKGNAVFWTGSGQYKVTVTFLGQSRDITKNFISTPSCGQDGCANFNNIAPGTYSFFATNGAQTWNGNITIKSNECSTMKLTGGYKAIENHTDTPVTMAND